MKQVWVVHWKGILSRRCSIFLEQGAARIWSQLWEIDEGSRCPIQLGKCKIQRMKHHKNYTKTTWVKWIFKKMKLLLFTFPSLWTSWRAFQYRGATRASTHPQLLHSLMAVCGAAGLVDDHTMTWGQSEQLLLSDVIHSEAQVGSSGLIHIYININACIYTYKYKYKYPNE